jgi:hypothetical protein
MGRDDGGDTLGQCEEQATQPLQFGETGGGGGPGRPHDNKTTSG